MPAFGVYPIADALTPGDEISSTYEGRHVTLLESELIHPSHTDGLVDKGDPVVFGTTALQGVGVAFASAAAATEFIAVDTEGIWNLDVVAADDGGNSAVEGGDRIYISITTGILSKIADSATNIPFGYALGHIDAGSTEAIAVKVHWDPIDNAILDSEPFYFGDGRDANLAFTDATGVLALTMAVINPTTGRILKLSGAVAAPNFGDGYGAFENELTASGTIAGTFAASSTWINFAAASVPGGNLICVRNDGIYLPTGITTTTATMIIGGRLQYVDTDGANPGGLYLWSTNIFDNALTAIFHVNAAVDFAWTTGAKTTNAGSIPLFRDVSAGKTWYVNVYDG
jgi:hypothetical protein